MSISNLTYILAEIADVMIHTHGIEEDSTKNIMLHAVRCVAQRHDGFITPSLFIEQIEKTIKKPLYQWTFAGKIEHKIRYAWSIIAWKILKKMGVLSKKE